MKKENYYLLFGHDVTRAYDRGGVYDVIETIKAGEGYDLICCPVLSDPLDLLVKYDGWDGFAQITKADYDKIIKATDGTLSMGLSAFIE